MGVQIIFTNGNLWAGKEEARNPGQVCLMPQGGNSYSYSGYTGTIAAALAANSEVLQFRFLAGTKTYALIERIEFEGMGIVAVPTAAGPLGFEAVPARAWTAAGSGGTRINPASNNLKLETPLNTSQVSDLGIATTGALTAGTKTLDTNAIGGVLGGVGTAAVTVYGGTSIITPGMLFERYQNGDMPLVLANQEGFVIRTTHAGPATMTYAARFGISWREVAAF